MTPTPTNNKTICELSIEGMRVAQVFNLRSNKEDKLKTCPTLLRALRVLRDYIERWAPLGIFRIVSPTRNHLTFSSTHIIQSIGIHGARKHSKKRAGRQNQSSCPLAIPLVTGATSWPTNPSKARR